MNGKIIVLLGSAVLISMVGYLLFAPDSQSDMALPVPDNHIANVQAGETAFKRYCTSCHRIAAPDGTVIAGASARSGPNLWGVAGREAGAVDGYQYSRAMQAADTPWTQSEFIAFVQDPSGYLKMITGNDRARSKMGFKLRGAQAAITATDIFVYLDSLQK